MAIVAFGDAAHRFGFCLAAVVLGVVAASELRIIRRVGETIEVRTIFRARRFQANRARLGVITRSTGRYSGINIELMAEARFEPNGVINKAILVQSFTPMGLDAPVKEARRASRVLGLPDPIVAPWLSEFVNQGDGEGPRDGSGTAPRVAGPRVWRWLLVVGLAIIPLQLLWGRHVDGKQAELLLRCQGQRDVRTPVGQFTLMKNATLSVNAGNATVEAWDASRSCWAGRQVTLDKGVRSVVDVDVVARDGKCGGRVHNPSARDSWRDSSDKMPGAEEKGHDHAAH